MCLLLYPLNQFLFSLRCLDISPEQQTSHLNHDILVQKPETPKLWMRGSTTPGGDSNWLRVHLNLGTKRRLPNNGQREIAPRYSCCNAGGNMAASGGSCVERGSSVGEHLDQGSVPDFTMKVKVKVESESASESVDYSSLQNKGAAHALMIENFQGDFLQTFHEVLCNTPHVKQKLFDSPPRKPMSAIELQEKQMRMFSCNKCSQLFSMEVSFNDHPSKPFCLDNDKFGSLPKINFCKSCQATDKEIPKKIQDVCLMCNKTFCSISALRRHHKIHLRGKPYTCHVCSKAFFWLSSLNEHKRIHTGEKPYSCSVCSMAFSHVSTFRKHKKKHREGKQFECYVCHETFVDRKILKGHQKTHKEAKQKNLLPKVKGEASKMLTISKMFKCSVCHETFANKTRLRDHRSTHYTDQSIKCCLCNKLFSRLSSLKNHQRVHTGEKICSVCNKCFTSSSLLQQHIRIHQVPKPYKCPLCPQAFTRLSASNKHQSVHTGLKPHQCPMCHKAFARTTHLRKHEVTHTGEKPYKCSMCDRSFGRRTPLKRHERIHEREIQVTIM
uniref:zinc finger protein 883-like isoform X1 n=1 Tax=Myxine glutinosa TaxID=7769 RepID=UPI00358F2F69